MAGPRVSLNCRNHRACWSLEPVQEGRPYGRCRSLQEHPWTSHCTGHGLPLPQVFSERHFARRKAGKVFPWPKCLAHSSCCKSPGPCIRTIGTVVQKLAPSWFPINGPPGNCDWKWRRTCHSSLTLPISGMVGRGPQFYMQTANLMQKKSRQETPNSVGESKKIVIIRQETPNSVGESKKNSDYTARAPKCGGK